MQTAQTGQWRTDLHYQAALLHQVPSTHSGSSIQHTSVHVLVVAVAQLPPSITARRRQPVKVLCNPQPVAGTLDGHMSPQFLVFLRGEARVCGPGCTQHFDVSIPEFKNQKKN